MKKYVLVLVNCSLLVIQLRSQVRIEMVDEGGLQTITSTVNGLELRTIVDSNAKNVSISIIDVIFMIDKGYLDKNALHGTSFSLLTKGIIEENATVNLKEVEIGGIKISNIEATINPELYSPLVLGQPAIRKLGKIQIEGNQLIIYLNSYLNDNDDDANEYEKSKDCLKNKFMADSLFQAYNSGLSDHRSLETAINYYEMYLECPVKDDSLKDDYFVYSNLSRLYCFTYNYERAMLFAQKSLSIADKDFTFGYSYFNLGFYSLRQEKYIEAVNYYEKSIEYQLSVLATTLNEVMSGNIHDFYLADTFYDLFDCYSRLGDPTNTKNNLIKSALCGSTKAIGICKQYNIQYELLKE